MAIAVPASSQIARQSEPLSREPVAHDSIVRLSTDQYEQMIELGIVEEGSASELLDGLLVRKDRSSPGEDPMGHSPRHRLVISLLGALAAKITSAQCHLQLQLPIVCPPDGVPEPDAALVRGTPRDYADHHPGPTDVFCIIEVSHSSVGRDRAIKLPIYAAAGISQYVIINLVVDAVEVYCDPDPASAQYQTKRTLHRGQMIQLQVPSGVVDVAIADLLP
jgi:Uma2 family endonuclease